MAGVDEAGKEGMNISVERYCRIDLLTQPRSVVAVNR